MLRNTMMIRNSYKKSVVNFISNIFQSRSLSNKSCVFTKPHRLLYLRLYPTLIVKPDGSTYVARFEEPRKIIKLPIDLSTLTEKEKAEILANRKPKKRILIQQEDVEDYDNRQYLSMMRRK